MTGKEYLQQAYYAAKKVKDMESDIKRLEEAATMCGSSLSGMPRSPSGEKSRLESIACKIADKKHELVLQIADLRERQSQIMLLLTEMQDEDSKRLLELRYVKGKDWHEIKTSMHFGRSWTFKLHDLAVAEFEKILQKNKEWT